MLVFEPILTVLDLLTLLCGLVQFAIGLEVHVNVEHVCTSEELFPNSQPKQENGPPESCT